MKKVYTKPEIMFEDFSLNNSITVGCEKIALGAPDACALDITTSLGPVSIFITDTVCTTVKPDGYNDICYHVPTVDNNVFTS